MRALQWSIAVTVMATDVLPQCLEQLLVENINVVE